MGSSCLQRRTSRSARESDRLIGVPTQAARKQSLAVPPRSLLAIVNVATPFANDAEKLAGSAEGLALDPERSVEVRVKLTLQELPDGSADQGHAIVEAAACGSGAGIGSAVRVDGDEDDIARGQHRGGRQGHTECQKSMYVIRSGDARDIGHAGARVTCRIRIGLVERRDGRRRRQRGTSPGARRERLPEAS